MPFDESRRSNLLGLAGLALAATVPGCGGSGGSGTGGGGGVPATLQALEFTTPATAVPPGQSVALAVSARYSDGTSSALGGPASWQSSNPAVATVGSDGRLTALAEGSTTITVTYQSITASLTLRVGIPLQALELLALPFRLALGLGGTWQLFTLGHASNGSTEVKTLAQWSSSSPDVATVGQGALGGLVTGIAAGTTTISCRLEGLTASARITVLGHQRIAHSDTDTLALECVTAADSSGRALAVWSRGFSNGGRPDLSWSQYRASTGWSAEGSLRPLPLAADPRSSSLALSLQDTGTGWAAWQQPNGLFAARFSPDTGWSAPVLVDATGTSFGNILAPLALKVDRVGNGLLVWTAYANGFGSFQFSRLDSGTGLWSAAAPVPSGGIDGLLMWWKLVGNSTGDACLLWSRMQMSPTGSDGSVQALRWQRPPTNTGWGWQGRDTLWASTGSPNSLAACMDEDGATLVGAVSSLGLSANGRINSTIRTMRHLPGQGWQTEAVVVASTDQLPEQLALSSAAGQGAGALWENGRDMSVHAARMSAHGDWTGLGAASDTAIPADALGDPTRLGITQLQDGRLLTSWISSDFFIASSLVTRVHHPVDGWNARHRDTGVGRLGHLQTFSLEYTSNGQGLLAWAESNQGGGDYFGHMGWVP